MNSRLHDSCSQDCGGTECIARVNQIEFVVEEVALGQLFLPVSIIPPMRHSPSPTLFNLRNIQRREMKHKAHSPSAMLDLFSLVKELRL